MTFASFRNRIAAVSVFVLVVLCATFAAGCGGDSGSSKVDKADAKAATQAALDEAADKQAMVAYEKGLETAGTQLTAVGNRFIAAKDFDDYGKAVAVLDAIVKSMDALVPPKSIADEHAELVQHLKDAHLAAARITANSSEASDAKASDEAGAALDAASASVDAITTELS
jgi:hypothetical protein